MLFSMISFVGTVCLQWSLLHSNSRSRSPLSFVFPHPNLPTVPAQSSYTSSPIFAFLSPMTMGISFFRVLAIVSSSVS